MAGHTHQEYENYLTNYAEAFEQLETIKAHLETYPDPFDENGVEFTKAQTLELLALVNAIYEFKEKFKIA